MEFLKLNLNPKKHKAGDCVVRAISRAAKKTWSTVYEDLCQVGWEECDLPDTPRVYRKYLEEIGWVKKPMPRYGDNTRYTVKDFADGFSKGVYIVSIACHLTVIENGTLVDTWNCGYKYMGNYWVKE